MADQGDAILVIVWRISVFKLCLLKSILKSPLIIEMDYKSHVKHFGRLSGSHLVQNLNFGRQTFVRKIKSMESSSNMKVIHNVD